MKNYLIIFCLCLLNYFVPAQSVSPFTGSFNYNFPLLNVPSNRGAPGAIDASYNAGIQMNQPASEIGLGWNLDAGGAIYRSVSGVPDDASAHLITQFSPSAFNYGQGALYPAYSYGITNFDLLTTKRGLDTTEFTYPNFDSYSLMAPGFAGQIKLSYNKFYSYSTSPDDGNGNKYINPNDASLPGTSGYYRRPQFHFVGDFADTLTSRQYSTTVTGSTPFATPTTTMAGNGYTSSTVPFIGSHLTGTVVSNQNYDLTTGRLATSNFVEYFTNAEIDAANSGSFAASPSTATLYALNSFIDYKSTHSRTATTFPASGIGAFRVTGSNGLTYHYSLPVYELENINYMTPLNNDYSLPSTATISMFGDGNPTDILPSSYSLSVKQMVPNKFAVKWLLTAVTGPDYVDNGNHQVDDADAGYWMSYDYQLWSSSFTTRSPQYGYDLQFQPDNRSEFYPLFFPPTCANYKLTGLYATVNVRKAEVYYLSKIRSSSHTAIIVRDIRLDEKGGDSLATHTSSFVPAPDLKVTRVMLFKNTELDSILSAYPKTSFSASLHTQFNFSLVTNSTQFFTEEWWSNAPNWKYCILKHVEFDQDYSLCKKYYGNVNVNCVGSTALSPQTAVQTSLSVGTNSLSGKLTLNRILIYDFQNTKMVPSTIYDYDKNNVVSANSNPDFNPQKTDYWGYYKSDVTSNAYSRYTTKISKNYTKAWSLLKITDPLGGVSEMEYESNSYIGVLDGQNSGGGGVRGPAFIYRINAVNELGIVSNSTFSVTLEEGYNSPDLLTEFSYLKTDSISYLKKEICIPWISAVAVNDSYVLPNIITGEVPEHGFQFGHCTYTVGIDNNISGSVYTNSPVSYWTAESYVPRRFTGSNTSWVQATVNTYSIDGTDNAAYSGNGFLMLEAPFGYTAYGSGVRVKKLKLHNTGSEVYVKEYYYEGGIAPNEADRFEYPRYKKGCGGSALRYNFLDAKENSPLDMGTYIGYSKVTVQDLGQINTANGKVETYFVNQPGYDNFKFSSNFLTTSFSTNTITGTYPSDVFNVKTINECVNLFASIFGATEETRVYDKNDNMISRTYNLYEPTTQGALTENFHFVDASYTYKNGASSAVSSTVNILRQIPVVLKSTTNYGMGTFEK